MKYRPQLKLKNRLLNISLGKSQILAALYLPPVDERYGAPHTFGEVIESPRLCLLSLIDLTTCFSSRLLFIGIVSMAEVHIISWISRAMYSY